MLAVHPTRDKSVHWAACHHPVLLREDQGPNVFGDRECWKPGGAGPPETIAPLDPRSKHDVTDCIFRHHTLRLRSLYLLNDMETSLFSDRWLESLLRSKQELVKGRALPEICSTSISTPATSAANLIWMDWVNEIKVPVRTDDNKASRAIEELCLKRTTVSHDE
ncbi:hypothetical protein BGZ88_000730 [Linnemannia elongata]|nr:hypothetical protein BGZ88_000730 [Linnemannia elongata]